MEIIVFGNVALDVLCRSVERVPRYDSIGFEQVMVAPGGCASNVAVGLRAFGVETALIARTGQDPSGDLLEAFWHRWGIDLRSLQRTPGQPTGVSHWSDRPKRPTTLCSYPWRQRRAIHSGPGSELLACRGSPDATHFRFLHPAGSAKR